MKTGPRTWGCVARRTMGVVLVGLLWEFVARSGLFPPALAPTVETIGAALGRMALDGTLVWHLLFTLYRVLSGLLLAAVVGIPLGMLMGRFRMAEKFLLPLMSILMPIPSTLHDVSPGHSHGSAGDQESGGLPGAG